MQWNMDHSRHNIEDVAAGYDALPKYDPEAAYAWKHLAQESKKHADYIRQHLNVTETDNPEPYDTSEDMIRDIRNNKNFIVSTANADHPIWKPEDNINFRIVHDVFGHAATDGDFGWHGENDACSTHFALSSPHAQKALATECLGQTGYAIDRGGFTDQRVGFIPGLHEGLAAANKDTPIPTQAQLMQRALYGPSKQSKWKTAANAATEQRIQRIADQARSKGLDVQQYNNDGYLETQIHIGQDEYYDSRYVIYISHGNNRTQSIFYDRPESKDYRTNLSAIEQEINSIDSENFDEMNFGRQTSMFDDKKILWNRFSRIKRSQDANRMYRQHTDGPPAAETTFESIQNEDTSEEHEDEEIMVNGKKWKMVRRKNNPQPDTYKDPIGGWGFYSKLIDEMEKQPWVIVSAEKAKSIDVANINQYYIPRNYRIINDIVPNFSRYGVIPIARRGSHSDAYSLTDVHNSGRDRFDDHTYMHNIYLYDPETHQIVYGMDYMINGPNAFDYHSEEDAQEYKYPTYVDSIHYFTPTQRDEQDGQFVYPGDRIYLSALNDKGHAVAHHARDQEVVDQFNKRYPRLSLAALRWIKDELPKPIGAEIINPKLEQKAQKQDFVSLSKWKLSVPPAEKAEEYAKGYEQSNEPTQEYLEERYKWNPEVRGHRWKLNYKNLEKVFNHPDFPVSGKYNVFTVDPKSAPTEDTSMKHWRRTPLGSHEAASPNRAGTIHINPLISAESANEALWHELQHAYQDQEGRFTPELREKYFNPTDISGLSDEEVDRKFKENYLEHPMEIDANKFADFMRQYPLIEESEPVYKSRWVNFSMANKDVDDEIKSIIDKYYEEHGSKRRLPLPSIESKWKKKSTYLPGYHSVALQKDPETGKYRMYMGAGPQFSHYQSIPPNSQLAEYRGIYDPTSGNLIHFTNPTEYQRVFDDPEYREKGWEYLINPEHFDATPEEHEKVWRNAAKEGIHIYETEQQGLNPEFRGVEHFPINSFYLMHRANEDSDKLSLGTTQDENYIPMIDKEKMEENAKRKHHVTFIPSLNNGKLSKWKLAGETKTKLLERAAQLPEDSSEIIHQFDDGWTIRKLNNAGDMHREGELMGNCLSCNNWEGPYRSWYWDLPNGPNEDPEYWKEEFKNPIPEGSFYSLRDTDNIPHVTIGGLYDNIDILGKHNSEVKEKYKKYLNDFFTRDEYNKYKKYLVSKQSKWKLAGETKTKLLERASQLPEDTSEIIHQFDDGWTIRKLNTVGDAHREGKLMSNCINPEHEHCPWSSEAEDKLIEKDPGLKEELEDVWQFPWHDYFDEDLNKLRHSNSEYPIYSLRDSQNIPHATYDSWTLGEDSPILGRHNYLPKPEYRKYWDEWFATNGKQPFNWNQWDRQSSVIKEAPARSKAQYRYMQGICNGSIEPPEGMTRAQACEYVEGQSSKGLPEKKSHWVEGYHAAVLDPRNKKIYVADSPKGFHSNALADNGYRGWPEEAWRGLYNPETQDLVHMSSPYEEEHPAFWEILHTDKMLHHAPSDYRETWLGAAENQGLPVSSVRVMTHEGDNAYDLPNSPGDPGPESNYKFYTVYDEDKNPKEQNTFLSKIAKQEEMEESLIKMGFSEKAAVVIALDYISKLSYWIDGYHAAVALRDPETEVWHMDVGFSDKLTHGGVTADYINDLGTRAMREAVADKNSRTDYYNYHTARGLYNPTTKDFIHMSHPDFWDETDYNFKSLDQDQRDRMEAFWKQLAQQNGVELDSIRVLNNQTGHIEDLSIADFEMPEEVNRARRMRERNRPLTPWEREQGGYDTKTGHVKNAHWIQGFQAAIINQKGELEVAPPDKEILNEEGNVIDVDDTPWYATHWDIGGYPQYRGLYNHNTGELIHMSSPEEHQSLSNIREYLESKNDAINPLEHETIWREAAKKTNIPISDFKLLYEKEEDEYGDEAPYKRWSEPMNQKEDFNLVDPEEFMPKQSKWKKRGHWLEDYYAAVITPKGEMKVAKDWGQFHGDLLPDAATLAQRGFHRGLYNKETGQLLHMTTPEEWKKLEYSWGDYEGSVEERWPLGFEWFNDPKHFISPYKTEKEWLKASENSEIPVSEVKFFSGEPEVSPFAAFDVNNFNLHSPDDIAQIRMSKWKISKKDAWEAVLDGELGHDIITTGTWEEVKKQTIKWLKQLKDGYINKKNPHDNKKIDPEAKEQDGHALEDLKLYEEKKRWSFHFDHGKHPYDLIIQPVGYKESKWKLSNVQFEIEGNHIYAILNNKIVGDLEFINYDDDFDGDKIVEIEFIRVDKQYRRTGIGKLLLEKLYSLYPNHEFQTTGVTPLGEKLINSFERDFGKEVDYWGDAPPEFPDEMPDKQSKWKKSQEKNIIDHLVSQGHRYLYHDANYNDQFHWPESDANDYYEKIKNIMTIGLQPQRDLGFSSAPRSYGGHPDFVYLSSDPAEIIVDITKLNPNNFVADDDMYLSEWQDAEEGYGMDLGEWVHNESGLVRPEDVFDSIAEVGAVAYRGTIPPQALSINPGFLDKTYRKNSKWKIADKKKRKVHPKFQTSLKDHQRSIRKYGPLKTHKVRNFKKKSVLNEQQAKELFAEDPYMYHDVSAARSKDGWIEHIPVIDSIFKNGILPKEQTGIAEYDDWLTSRPDHVYIGKKDFYSKSRKPALRVDMSKVDPSTLAPDEDLFPVYGYNNNYSHRMDFKNIKSPPFEQEQPQGSSLGDWMHEHSHLDTPKNVKASKNLIGSVAVNGGVPADAIHYNPEWLEEAMNDIGITIESVEAGIEDENLKIEEYLLSSIIANAEKVPPEMLDEFMSLYNRIHSIWGT